MTTSVSAHSDAPSPSPSLNNSVPSAPSTSPVHPIARVPDLPKLGLLQRMVARYTQRLLGKVPSALKIFFRNKSVLKGYLGMEWALKGADKMPIQLKTLAQIRVATLVGCPF